MTQQSKYENKNPLHQWVLSRFLRKVVEAINASDSNQILDLASADGYVDQQILSMRPNARIVGVDIDEEAIQRAKILNPKATFLMGDIYSYMHPEPVDIVLTLEVFEHLKDYERAFDNILKIRASHYLISVPREPYFRILNLLRGRHVSRLGNHPEHVNLWTKSAFRRLIEKRFSIVRDYSSFPWSMYLLKPRK